jgi:hypothetical protein
MALLSHTRLVPGPPRDSFRLAAGCEGGNPDDPVWIAEKAWGMRQPGAEEPEAGTKEVRSMRRRGEPARDDPSGFDTPRARPDVLSEQGVREAGRPHLLERIGATRSMRQLPARRDTSSFEDGRPTQGA